MSRINAKKHLGQHFLSDPNILYKMADTINPKADDHLIEIGPGRAALTHHLIGKSQQLDVIELDKDLINDLNLLDGCRVYHQDALKHNFHRLSDCGEAIKVRVIGNLPYNISTPLLFHLLSHQHIQDMHFLLQKEVADRLVATAGSRDYGRLSVMAQLHCHIQRCFHVAPGCFIPPPKVDSTFVQLHPHPAPLLPADQHEAFAKIVKQAFSQRRKTLRNSLKSLLSAEQIREAGLDPTLRPERITVNEFIQLTHHYD
jgi:16S rRNA (adenine1518-N6/adenine1519-N6)-dimethyltransferase